MDTTHTTEELLSGQLDNELTAREGQELREALEGDPELVGLSEEFHRLTGLFASYKATTAQEVPLDRFWEELSPKLSVDGVLQRDTVSNTEILKLLSERMQKPSLWERFFSGMVPAMVGAAVAVAAVFFLVGPQKGAPARDTAPQVVAVKQAVPVKRVSPLDRRAARSSAVTVSTKPEIQPGAVVPDPAVASIVAQTESCTIESMNAEDDTITTVFKVADRDGSMITVIWLPVEDEGTSI